MTSSDRVLARRYAQALFQETSGPQEQDAVRQELTQAHRILSADLPLFKHPLVAASRKKTVLREGVGRAISTRTLRFLELLVDKKRFGMLAWIVAEYGRLLDERRGWMRAQVRSASALTDADAGRLCSGLEAFSGRHVHMDMKVDPELLGGVVVRMGDWVLDGSLQGRLRQLRTQLGLNHA